MRQTTQHVRFVLAGLLLIASVVGATPAAAEETDTPWSTIIDGDEAYYPECDITQDGTLIASVTTDFTSSPDFTLESTIRLTTVATGAEEEIAVVGAFNRVHMSEDGRYLTYTWVPSHAASGSEAHLFQLDRSTGLTTKISSQAGLMSFLRTSPDGSIVFWSQRQWGTNRLTIGPATAFVWGRSNGQVYDVTQNDDDSYPSTPLRGAFRPWVDDDYRLWDPLTGATRQITSPAGSDHVGPYGVSLDGQRLAYLKWTSRGIEAFVITRPDGSVVAEIAVPEPFQPHYTDTTTLFSDDGDRLIVLSARYGGDDVGDRVASFVWNIPDGSLRELNLPSLSRKTMLSGSVPGICGGSSDLRWVIARLVDTERNESSALLDLDRVAPTAIDPSMLEGDQLTDQINRLYAAYFLRAPDAGGLQYWRILRASGTSLGATSTEFAASPEFEQRYGALDNRSFVELVYQNVLGRTPDAQGWSHWTSVLDGGTSRGDVMLGFSESTENIATTATAAPVFDPRLAQIDRLYQAYFDRPGDAAGLTYWFDLMKNGASLADAASAFSTSTEFVSAYGDLSDAEFVDLVYQNVLNRAADPRGRDFWETVLVNGSSRGVIMASFSESTEFILKTDSIPPAG